VPVAEAAPAAPLAGIGPAPPPRAAIEATVATIWSEALHRDSVDLHDHFFDLGGVSLQALRIMARIRRTFAVELDVRSLIDAPTVAEMARLVGERLVPRTATGEPPSPERAAAGKWAHLVELRPDAGAVRCSSSLGASAAGRVLRVRAPRPPRRPGASFLRAQGPEREGRRRRPTASGDGVGLPAGDPRAAARGPLIVVGECAGGHRVDRAAPPRGGQEPALLLLMDTPRPDDLRPRAHFLHITRWTITGRSCAG
jgi:acyl carrier protein